MLTEILKKEGISIHSAAPGRLRLRVDRVKGDPALADSINRRLADVPGILEVEARPLTGSVLIGYDLAALFQSEDNLFNILRELCPDRDVDQYRVLINQFKQKLT